MRGAAETITARHAVAAIVAPPRCTAVARETAETDPTPRDHHLDCIAERGRICWQKASGCNKRSRVEAASGRFKQVIGDGWRSRADTWQDTEVAVCGARLSALRGNPTAYDQQPLPLRL
jgi:hypothetical protein